MGYEQGLARRFLEMERDKAAYGAPHAAHRTLEEGLERGGRPVVQVTAAVGSAVHRANRPLS